MNIGLNKKALNLRFNHIQSNKSGWRWPFLRYELTIPNWQYDIVHMIWTTWYEMTRGIKRFIVWSSLYHEVVHGMKCVMVWSDSRYEVTQSTGKGGRCFVLFDCITRDQNWFFVRVSANQRSRKRTKKRSRGIQSRARQTTNTVCSVEGFSDLIFHLVIKWLQQSSEHGTKWLGAQRIAIQVLCLCHRLCDEWPASLWEKKQQTDIQC